MQKILVLAASIHQIPLIQLAKKQVLYVITSNYYSENFEHHKAMVQGLISKNSNYTFLIDVDLEEEPELFESFYHRIIETVDDFVYGVQRSRNKDRFFGRLYWKILTTLTNITFEKDSCTVSIMNEKFISKMRDFKQSNLILIESYSHIGLRQSTITMRKAFKGSSSYSFIKKYDHLFNVIINNSNNMWLKLSFISIICSFLLFGASMYLVISSLAGYDYLSGWFSLMLVVSLFFSVCFLFFAIMLQLLSKILDEVKRKPRVVIDEEIVI